MRKVQGMILILLTAIFMIIILPKNISVASVSSEIQSVESKVNQPEGGEITTTIGKILGFLQVAAGLTSIIVIAFTGFEYIVASTPSMKDELKKKMLPIVIGLVLVFGAVSIAQFIVGGIESTK